MDGITSGPTASTPRKRRLGLKTSGLLLVVVGGLLFAQIIRDNRNPFEKIRDDKSRKDQIYTAALRDAKTAEDRQKIEANKPPNQEAFAQRCLELAKSEPNSPAELAALCWIISNVPGSKPGEEAFAILKGGRLDNAKPAELLTSLESARTFPVLRSNPLIPFVLKIAKRNLNDPETAGLLTWVCVNQFGDNSVHEPPSFAEAADIIASRFAASPIISNFCETLGSGSGSPAWAGKYEKHLRTVLDKNQTRLVRCTASFALASIVQGTGEERQDEAQSLYQQFVKDFNGSDPSIKPVEDVLIQSAKTEAAGIRVRKIGATAPATESEDLEGQQMTLVEFRGKVVLVTFWATWCGPCMQMIPHERELLERFKDKQFAIVGVNGDRVVAEHGCTTRWDRSFWSS